jgi:hypothetical protein
MGRVNLNSAILLVLWWYGKARAGPHTWRAVWVVVRECHLGLEEGAIVDRVRVDDHEGDMPLKDVLVDELCVRGQYRKWHTTTVPEGHTSMLVQGSLERALNSDIRIFSAMMRDRGVGEFGYD